MSYVETREPRREGEAETRAPSLHRLRSFEAWWCPWGPWPRDSQPSHSDVYTKTNWVEVSGAVMSRRDQDGAAASMTGATISKNWRRSTSPAPSVSKICQSRTSGEISFYADGAWTSTADGNGRSIAASRIPSDNSSAVRSPVAEAFSIIKTD